MTELANQTRGFRNVIEEYLAVPRDANHPQKFHQSELLEGVSQRWVLQRLLDPHQVVRILRFESGNEVCFKAQWTLSVKFIEVDGLQ